MNHFLNIIRQTPATSGNTAAGASAAVTADAGVFAQIMGGLVPRPAAAAPVNGESAPATATPAQLIVTAEALPEPSADAAREAVQQDADTSLAQPDTALVAALLGQLQMPYVMPAPLPVQTGDDVASAVPSEPRPMLTGAVGAQGMADTLTTPGAPVEADVAAAMSGAPLQSPAEDALAVSPAPAHIESLARTDKAHGVAAATATHDAKAAAAMTPDRQALPAHDGPLPPAASAAIAAANPRAAILREASSTDGAGNKQPAAAHRENAAGEAVARPVSAQAYDDVRRVMQLQPAYDEREIPATAVAAQAAAGSSARQARGLAVQEAPDRIGDFASVAAGLPAAVATRSEGAASPFTLAPHVQSPEWQPAFAGNVKLLVKEGTSAATLQLNPAEFGPIDVRIVVTDQRADIAFMVSHPDANAAIQSALSELRDQLAQSGIQLGQTSVGAHSQQPQQSRPTPASPQRGAPAGSADASLDDTTSPARPQRDGSIDIYA